MSKLVCVLVLCAIVAAAAIDADTETEFPAGKPRPGKALKGVRQTGKSYGNQKVVTVPKGDPRAQSPVVPPRAPKHPKEERVIVEADVVPSAPEPAITGPIYRHEIFPAPTKTDSQIRAEARDAAIAAAVPTPTATISTASHVLKAGAPTANPGACLARWNGATAAAKATQYQAAYKARRTKYSQQSRQYGINAKYADCSSYVTSILNDIGMNCLFASGRNTANMNKLIRARGGYKQVAKVGDIVMWGGHTGMITKVCSPTTFTMTAMGNSGAGLAVCKTVAQLKSWGSGGWLGFWTPRP